MKTLQEKQIERLAEGIAREATFLLTEDDQQLCEAQKEYAVRFRRLMMKKNFTVAQAAEYLRNCRADWERQAGQDAVAELMAMLTDDYGDDVLRLLAAALQERLSGGEVA